MAIQQNNGGPVGYGQPRRGAGMRQRLMRPEDEELFGQRRPEVEDMRLDPTIGNGQPPNVYPPQPPGIPQGWRQDQQAGGGQFGNYGMPGRTPLAGQQPGQENAYARQAYQTRTTDPFTAGIRNAMAMSTDAPYQGRWGDAGRQIQDAYRRDLGREANEDEIGAHIGYGRATAPGNIQHAVKNIFESPEAVAFRRRQQSQSPAVGQPPGPQGDYSALQAAVQQSMSGFTDIAGMRDVFKPGQFMNQLEGFNTNAWGTSERGSNTLKNMFGTIASNYDVSQPGALQKVMPDILKALPNATIVPHPNEDLLDPDGPNGPMQPVDVIRAATAGGQGAGWQWAPVDQQSPGAQMGGPQGPSRQIYNQTMTQLMPQAGGVGGEAPEVADTDSAMKFLEWLMEQQNQGLMPR